jgi:AcrR family transcriptional regulator
VFSERQREILRVTYELLGEVGYQGLRFDAVANRARTSKATLYRHWPSKADLVADAIGACRMSAHAAPDTGSLRGDLLALVGRMAAAMAGEEGPLLAGLVMAMHTDPEFACRMRALHVSKQPIVEEICTRAVARGELTSDRGQGLIDELAAGQLFMHGIVHGEPLDEPFVTHLVDDVLLPLLTRRPDPLTAGSVAH